MNDLFLIPARGGSKGIPGKNIKPLGDRPLIYYTLDAAINVADPGMICVSTDSDKIIAKVKEYGVDVPFKRPPELATDTAGSDDVILHSLDFYEQKGLYPNRVILLQPTSPFRTSKHILEALALYEPGLDMVVSVKPACANPYYTLFEEDKDGFLKPSKRGDFERRQDCPPVFEFNGAIYVIDAGSIKSMAMKRFSRVRKYVMNEEDSVDLDTPLDWVLAEAVIAQKTSLGTKETQI